MGAGKKQALRLTFDRRVKVEFHGSKVTSDAGLLAYRELDEALGLADLGENLLNDWRTGKNTQHSMVVSSHPGEKGLGRTKGIETRPLPGKNRGRTGKKACKFVEKEHSQKTACAGRGQAIKWKILEPV
jgi:hypothetical protein